MRHGSDANHRAPRPTLAVATFVRLGYPDRVPVEKGFKNTNAYGWTFTVVGPYEMRKSQRWYLVRFTVSGYQTWKRQCDIISGSVRDPTAPTVLGVGCWGPRGTKARHPREATLWRNILERCYNPKSLSFPRYGGAGVKTCERWLNFPDFLQDLPNLPGYQYWKAGENYHLDKDLSGARQYGPHCAFVPAFDNVSAARKTRPVVFGVRYETFSEAAETLGVSPSRLARALQSGKYPQSNLPRAHLYAGKHV